MCDVVLVGDGYYVKVCGARSPDSLVTPAPTVFRLRVLISRHSEATRYPQRCARQFACRFDDDRTLESHSSWTSVSKRL